ncbi:uncharacterized protein METZ01_LOCUS251159 [marine metagenome]|uniref:L-threonylcarbamoyladenylate synthase n=1 Tax=marine metagenome TaxID=408172 RepID=A0A382IG36_9ZZZZ
MGCDPKNEQAVNKLLKIKNRSVDMGLILLGSNTKGIDGWLNISNHQKKTLLTPTEKPTTYLIPITNEAPPWVIGKHSSLALRISTMPIIQTLNEILGCPIVSTSANAHGKQPLQTKKQVEGEFLETLDYIVGGTCGTFNRPSSIVDIVTGKEIRS